MKKIARSMTVMCFLLISMMFFGSLFTFSLATNIFILLQDWTFYAMLISYLIVFEEIIRWLKQGRRSEMSDIVAILFFFFFIFFFTKDVFTSIIGAFSVYLWFGIFELKDYPVLNRLLIISLTTYSIIFVCGIISSYLRDPFIFNTSFAFSFWIILGLGFILFGRKYIVIWRFMSPEYLTLLLYIIAWLAVVFINQYTPLNLISQSPFDKTELNPVDFFFNIYFILILVNWLIYFTSGPILDRMLGIKELKNENLVDTINQVKETMGIKRKVRIGIGNYPILNAMAYGSFFDRRIALIVEDGANIPQDELKGIVAHEFAHSKKNHTLILTLITSIDLFIRMLIGFPATFYDYTFGTPQIPFFAFILINIGIYAVIYVFVRFLEGKADLLAKEKGYGKELVKALYNLESFYATGRQIGLNTMLLCEEKINREHQILDYIETAEYLSSSLIKPSRISLLSNFMHAHPPTYYRIAAILGEDLTPSKEALLSLICLKKSKIRKYASKFSSSRHIFDQIATQKFTQLFKITNISNFLQKLNRKELFEFDLNRDYVFTHKITNESILGTLKNVHFNENICAHDEFIVFDIKKKREVTLNASLYIKNRVIMGGLYFFDKKTPLTLIDVEFNKDYRKANYVFANEDDVIIKKKLYKTRLPNSIQILNDFIDNDLFLKNKGEIQILHCTGIKTNSDYDAIELELGNLSSKNKKIALSLKLRDLIVRPKNIYLAIEKSDLFRASEVKVLNWLLEKKCRIYIFLKKPVNNVEIGYLTGLELKRDETIDTPNINSLNFRNIFGQDIAIPYDSIEIISFDYKAALLQKKRDTSFISKLGYKIQHKIKPQKIMYLNKL
ncbi:MAG: hypothetical protein EU549_04065 [Promethearchaeota archaeon]|nr:MAG: hypothetical protein EU549_04065 [Candidatus Lokiarchaeota archaeon]